MRRSAVAFPIAARAAIAFALAAARPRPAAVVALFVGSDVARAALGAVVADPGGALVARAFEKAAVLSAAVLAAVLTAPIFEAVIRPSRTFISRRLARVVAVVCHKSSSRAEKRGRR